MKGRRFRSLASVIDVNGVGKIIAVINSLVALSLIWFYLRNILFSDGFSVTSIEQIGEIVLYGPSLAYLLVTLLLSASNMYCAVRLWKANKSNVRRLLLVSLVPLFVTVLLLIPLVFILYSNFGSEFILLLLFLIIAFFLLFVLWSQFKKLSVALFLITLLIAGYAFLSTLEENYCWRKADQAKDTDIMYYDLTEAETNFMEPGTGISGWFRTYLKCHESFNLVSALTDSIKD